MHGVPVSEARASRPRLCLITLEVGETLEDFLEAFPAVSRSLALAALEEAKQLFLPAPDAMRLLIDKCVDERLQLLFPDHDCQTARFANLA